MDRHASVLARGRAGPALLHRKEARPSGPVGDVLMLQRLLGNAAVARLLTGSIQRDDDANRGWEGATKGGWNDRRQTVEDIDRIPISGLGSFGIAQQDSVEQHQSTSKHHTAEAADHRCIALVPKALDPKQPT